MHKSLFTIKLFQTRTWRDVGQEQCIYEWVIPCRDSVMARPCFSDLLETRETITTVFPSKCNASPRNFPSCQENRETSRKLPV